MPYCAYCNKEFSLNDLEHHQPKCPERNPAITEIHFKSHYTRIDLNANVLWPVDAGKTKKREKRKSK